MEKVLYDDEPTLNIRGNLFGGVTAAVVALPLALAMGVQSGLGAAAGIYGAILLSIVTSLVGGTPTQISGPTGPMTVVSATIIADSIEHYGNLESALGFILFTFLLVGLVQIALGLLRVGDFVNYIPYPVISGFMTGIGIIMILLQIYPSLGYHSPGHVFQIIGGIQKPLHAINWQALTLALGTILITYGSARITRKIPGSLIALILMTFVAVYLKLDVPTIGEIPSGLPVLQLSWYGHLHLEGFLRAIVPALMLGTLGCIDSLLTSVIADNKTKTSHQSNRELLGQGLGNSIVALFGGIPGAGATIRTVVNINAGGTNAISGITHSLVLLTVLLGLSNYAKLIPLSVLSGILTTVGIGIIDYKGLKHIRHIPRSEAFIIILVALLTVFVNLLQAVAIGIIAACILFMKKMSEIIEERSHVSPIQHLDREKPWEDEAIIPVALHDKVYIKHLHGPLFFGFTSHFHGLIKSIPMIKVVIIRMGFVPYIDQSGLYAIEDAVEYLESKGIRVILTGLQKQPEDMLRSVGIIPNVIPESNLFKEFRNAVLDLENDLNLQHQTGPSF